MARGNWHPSRISGIQKQIRQRDYEATHAKRLFTSWVEEPTPPPKKRPPKKRSRGK